MDPGEIYYFKFGFWLEICLPCWHIDRFTHYNSSSQKRSKHSFRLEAIYFPADQPRLSLLKMRKWSLLYLSD